MIQYFYGLHTIPSYYKILTIYPVLYITCLWLIYFITGSLNLLIPFTCFTLLPHPLPSGNHQFVLCISEPVSVLFVHFGVFLFCFVVLNSTPGYLSEENENTILKRYIHPNVCCRIIYNSQDMEATLVPISRWMDKDVVCMFNRILLSQKKEWNFAICGNMDGSRGCYA